MNYMVNSQELLLEGWQTIRPEPEFGTILVVEDDPRMQKVLEANLHGRELLDRSRGGRQNGAGAFPLSTVRSLSCST